MALKVGDRVKQTSTTTGTGTITLDGAAPTGFSNFRDYLDGLLVASALIDEKFDISNYSQRLLK